MDFHYIMTIPIFVRGLIQIEKNPWWNIAEIRAIIEQQSHEDDFRLLMEVIDYPLIIVRYTQIIWMKIIKHYLNVTWTVVTEDDKIIWMKIIKHYLNVTWTVVTEDDKIFHCMIGTYIFYWFGRKYLHNSPEV